MPRKARAAGHQVAPQKRGVFLDVIFRSESNATRTGPAYEH